MRLAACLVAFLACESVFASVSTAVAGNATVEDPCLSKNVSPRDVLACRLLQRAKILGQYEGTQQHAFASPRAGVVALPLPADPPTAPQQSTTPVESETPVLQSMPKIALNSSLEEVVDVRQSLTTSPANNVTLAAGVVVPVNLQHSLNLQHTLNGNDTLLAEALSVVVGVVAFLGFSRFAIRALRCNKEAINNDKYAQFLLLFMPQHCDDAKDSKGSVWVAAVATAAALVTAVVVLGGFWVATFVMALLYSVAVMVVDPWFIGMDMKGGSPTKDTYIAAMEVVIALHVLLLLLLVLINVNGAILTFLIVMLVSVSVLLASITEHFVVLAPIETTGIRHIMDFVIQFLVVGFGGILPLVLPTTVGSSSTDDSRASLQFAASSAAMIMIFFVCAALAQFGRDPSSDGREAIPILVAFASSSFATYLSGIFNGIAATPVNNGRLSSQYFVSVMLTAVLAMLAYSHFAQ